MIANILKAKRSSKSVISYNEKKAENGDAFVVGSRNVEFNSRNVIEHTFERYEENPAISERARSRSFHMTVGAGPKDAPLSDEQVVEIVDQLMEAINYQNQPYVIYRHNDIEREHFHIVSTRFDQGGRKIEDSFQARKVIAKLKELAPVYGFTVGDPDKEQKKEVPADKSRVPSFKANEPNVLRRLESLYRRGLQYPVQSLYQMQAVMRGMNVRMTTRRNRSGGYNVLLRGLDKKGNPVTPYYSMRKMMKVDGVALLEEAIRNNGNPQRRDIAMKIALGVKSSYCMMKSTSAAEYARMLAQLDVFPGIVRDRKTDRIERVTLTDLQSDSILDTGWNDEMLVGDFVQAEAGGKWNSKGSKRTRALTQDEIDELYEGISAELEHSGYLDDAPEYARAAEPKVEQGSLFTDDDYGMDISE